MGYRDITNLHAFKEILTNSMYEGVKILKKMGVKEYKAHTMPTWAKIKASATLPNFITDGMFKKNLAKMVLSSMAQDIIQRKSGESELESLIGEFVSLGDRYGMDIPYNRAVYKTMQREIQPAPLCPHDRGGGVGGSQKAPKQITSSLPFQTAPTGAVFN